MPVFIILVLIGAILLWLLLSFTFPLIGKIASKLIGNVQDVITKEDEDTSSNKNKKEQ